ncbi:type II secretion system F family protein [bacterium]|nr:MAG: type II secretion system F family protein [bacterium]
MAEAASFEYLARRADGVRVRGQVQAASREAAVSSVRERALVPIRVCLSRPRHRLAILPTASRAVAGRELVGFMRSFAVMTRSGVPVLRILDVLAEEQEGRALKAALARMHASLIRGESFSRAAERAGLFTPVHVAMIRAGEAGGILDETLERVACVVARDHGVRRRVAAALTYPAVLAVAALLSVVLLIGTLTPALARLFAEMSAPLPPSTLFLLAAGRVIRSPVALIAATGTLIAVAAGVRALPRSARAAGVVERLALGLPLVGTLRRAIVVSRVSRTLGALLRGGLPTLEAIDLAAQSAGSPLAASALHELRLSLREGESLAQRLVSGGFFPALFVHMIRVGEECGTLDALLESVAEFYDVEAEAALHVLTTLIEPMLIALLGGVVAAIALAVFVPLYSLIGSLR